MKVAKTFTFILTVLFSIPSFAALNDSLVINNGIYKVYKNLNKNSFLIKNKDNNTVFENLKFVSLHYNFLQVISSKNDAFFLDNDLKKTESIDNIIGFCGTVPHYELRIKKTKTDFIILEDETFYDSGNVIPIAETSRISRSEADSVFFISGTDQFSFTANYGLSQSCLPNPRTIIYIKNDQYYIYGDKNEGTYDQIIMTNGLLKLMRKNLYSYWTNIEPKYSFIGDFNHNLARFELPNGQKGYIDNQGKPYFD